MQNLAVAAWQATHPISADSSARLIAQLQAVRDAVPLVYSIPAGCVDLPVPKHNYEADEVRLNEAGDELVVGAGDKAKRAEQGALDAATAAQAFAESLAWKVQISAAHDSERSLLLVETQQAVESQRDAAELGQAPPLDGKTYQDLLSYRAALRSWQLGEACPAKPTLLG